MPFVPFTPSAIRRQTPTHRQERCDSREHKPDLSVVLSGGPFVWECGRCGLTTVVRVRPVYWMGACR